MFRSRLPLLAALGLLPTAAAAAQARQLELTTSYERFGHAALVAADAAPLGATGTALRLGFERISARLALPSFTLAAHTTLQLGAAYERLTYAQDGATLSAPPIPGALHTAQLSVGVTQGIGGRWAIAGIVTPALVTDASAVDRHHVRLSGSLFAVRQVRPTLQVGFGAVLVNNVDAPIPAFRLAWFDGSRQRLVLVAPAFGEYAHSVGSRVELGATVRLGGNRYSVGAPSAGAFNRVETLQLTAGAFVGVALSPSTRLTFEGGAAPYQRLRQFIEGQPETSQRDLRAVATPYLRASVQARF